MQISNEIIWATASSVIVGIAVRTIGWWMERRSQEDEQEEARRTNYHKSIEDELKALWEENRRLREEADKYRNLYLELLSSMHIKPPIDTIQPPYPG